MTHSIVGDLLMVVLRIFILLSIIGSSSSKETPNFGDNFRAYNGYQIIDVRGLRDFKSENDILNFFNPNHEEENHLEILGGNKMEGTAQFLVTPEYTQTIVGKLKGNFEYEILTENLARDIWSEGLTRSAVATEAGGLSSHKYMTLEEIEKYLLNLSKLYPNKVVLKSIAETYEGRLVYMLTISDGVGSKWSVKSEERPVIFVESGAHAREWISPASTLHFIDRLLKTPIFPSIIEWRFIVVLNPDGYDYSWKNMRLWRKNRSDIKNSNCFGVDLNRNFDAQFQLHTNDRKCKSTYSGSKAFSENETEAVRSIVWNIRHRIQAYVSVHSYGQFLLHPPGTHSSNITLANKNKLHTLGDTIAKELNIVQKVKYTVGAPIDILYAAHGTSQDWAHLTANIPNVLTVELRDTGKEGFRLSPKRIVDTTEDLWIILQMVAGQVVKKDFFAFRGVSPSVGIREPNILDY